MMTLIWIALGFVLLRELGPLNFAIYDSRGESESSIKLNIHEKQDTSVSENGVRSVSMPLFGISSAQNHRLARLILRGLRGRFDDASREKELVSVHIQRIEVRGIYWLPLYKRATCRYEVACTLSAGERAATWVSKDMVLSGQVALAITGFCSVRSFCAGMATPIVESVIHAVRNQLADRGSPQDNRSEEG